MANPPITLSGLYLRAVILRSDDVQPVSSSSSVFGMRPKEIRTLGDKRAFGLLTARASGDVPSHLRAVASSSGGKFSYPVLVSDVSLPKSSGLLLATPAPEYMAEIIRDEGAMYARCDLARLCNHHLSASHTPYVAVSRFNGRIYNDVGVKLSTFTLYGDDVLQSQLIRNIIEAQGLDPDQDPFSSPIAGSHSAGKVTVEVNACRIKWTGSVKFGLNVDRFGNFSFYLKSADDLTAIHELLAYLLKLKALIVDTRRLPMKRSAESLERVAQ